MYFLSVKNFKSQIPKSLYILLCDTYDIYTTDTNISKNTYDVYHFQYIVYVSKLDLDIHIRLHISCYEKNVAMSISFMKPPYLNKHQMRKSLDTLLYSIHTEDNPHIYQNMIKQTYPTYFLKYMDKNLLYKRYIMFHGI